MTSVFLGLFLFALGIQPDIIGMNRSPVVGFVQVGTWLTGLAMATAGAYAAVRILRNGRPNSLRAEIGERLIATGYVVAAAASLADFIGIGSHEIPNVIFGPLQVLGLIIGVVLSLVGVVLYLPRRGRRSRATPSDPGPGREARDPGSSPQVQTGAP
jgi:hypothetical protein